MSAFYESLLADYKARAEAAEADARRYRWLRDSAMDAFHFSPMVFMCDPERELRWGDALTAGRLDAALAAELAKGGEKVSNIPPQVSGSCDVS